ncbi:MAG: ketoacyl-ACP synthase III [Clostridiaceae bacterium]|nr:ketoacyl-ACP synthase III [Clostridiaceae bacterium]
MHDLSVGILGTGMFLPPDLLTNHDLEKMVDTSDEWIVRRTGMKQRHILKEGIPSYTMGAEAAKLAIEDAGLTPMDIDLIIVTTETPDFLSPSMACLIQRDINAKNAAAFDLNAACTGFVYAVATAEQFIKTGYYRHVLIVSNEGLSRVTDYSNRNTCILFGDAAGAVVLGEVPGEYGIKESVLYSYGDLGYNLTIPCCYISEEDKERRPSGMYRSVWQDGSEVFTFAVRAMTDSTRKVLEMAGKTPQDIDMIIPHQANIRIINGAAKRLKIDDDKVMVILDKTGNISSASIPVAIDIVSREGRLKNGDSLVMVAFGGGLTCGAIYYIWGKNQQH